MRTVPLPFRFRGKSIDFSPTPGIVHFLCFRVFSAKSTLQNFTIPPALLLGGLLADTVFEPFMLTESPAQQVLSGFFGTGKGAGIGLMFFIVGIAGMAVSFARLRKPVYRELDREEKEAIQTND